jgi:oligoribonuclease NrnB/cAMP/cGMP phosphodiesterase (DHH superfamily)
MFNEAAVLMPVMHGQDPPTLPYGAKVYMLDFSYKRPVMEKLAAMVDLTVIDHHKTAQAELAGFPNCTFDMTKSGAVLAYEHFFPGCRLPILLEYIQDRDIWQWKMPDSTAVCAYIDSYEWTIGNFNFLQYQIASHFRDVVTAGNAILRYQEQQTRQGARNAIFTNVGGHLVPVVNAAMGSQVAMRLCELHPEAKFACYYFDRPDGKRQWGLRSNNGFDVSEIAKAYGGGGHAAAAGFETSTPSFLDV